MLNIRYDLTKSGSVLDHKRGEMLKEKGVNPVGYGVIKGEDADNYFISGSGFTDTKIIPKDSVIS